MQKSQFFPAGYRLDRRLLFDALHFNCLSLLSGAQHGDGRRGPVSADFYGFYAFRYALHLGHQPGRHPHCLRSSSQR